MKIVRSFILVLIGALLGFAAFSVEYSRPKDAPSLWIDRKSSASTPFQGYDSRIFPFVNHDVQTRFQDLVGYKESQSYLITAVPTVDGFDMTLVASGGAPAIPEAVTTELFQLARDRVNHHSQRFQPKWHVPGLE